MALDKSKEISNSNCKNQKKLQSYKLKITSKMFCNLCVPHLIGIPITLSKRPIFQIGRHPRANLTFELFLDLRSLFATCRNHKWEIKWGHDIMFNNILVVFGVFFSTDIEITIFVNVLRSECDKEMDDV